MENHDSSFGLTKLPNSDELSSEGLLLVRNAIHGLQDLGFGEAAVFYHLLYPAMIQLMPTRSDRDSVDLAPEIARSLVAIAANEVGGFCDPQEIRALAHDFERIATEASRR